MNYGEIIAKWRHDAGMKQRELADKVNVSCAMIAQIERGTKHGTLILLEHIAQALGHTIEELIQERGA